MINRLQDLYDGYDEEWVEELVMMDGYDDCIIGIVEGCNSEPVLCYDKEKVLSKLEEDGMDEEEAEEFFYFNQLGSRMRNAPCFITQF